MPTFLAGKKARWSIGSRQLCENRWHQRESDENQRSNDILCLCLSYLYLCVGTCAVEVVSCVMCRMWYVLLHIRALFGCVNVRYISVYCKSIDSLPLFALIGTKDPDQSFLLGSPWESEWWSTIPGKTWTSKWRKEDPEREQQKRKASWVPPEPFCGTVLSTIEWIFSREWQGAAPLCDLFQNIRVFAEKVDHVF